MKKMILIAAMLLSLALSAFAAQPPRFPKIRIRVPMGALSQLTRVPRQHINPVRIGPVGNHQPLQVVAPRRPLTSRVPSLPVIHPPLTIPRVSPVSPFLSDVVQPIDTTFRPMIRPIHLLSPSSVFSIDGQRREWTDTIRQQFDFAVDGFAYGIMPDTFGVVVAQWLGNETDSCHVVVPDSVIWQGKVYTVQAIGPGAFYVDHNLVSVTLPSSVAIVMNGAFCHCTALKSITLEGTGTMLLNHAVCGCFQLEEINVPSKYNHNWAMMYGSWLKPQPGYSNAHQQELTQGLTDGEKLPLGQEGEQET